MKFDNINTSERVMIIAEIGNNHEGDFSLAQKMVGLAAEAGADAVKFQTIVPEKLVASSDAARIQQLKKFQFSYDQFATLAKQCSDLNVTFLSTPFDIESAEFLSTIAPAFKVASSDNNFTPLLNAICKTGKPIIMSSGMAELEEVKRSVKFIEEKWNEYGVSSDLAILHCVSSYPTPMDQANMGTINYLKDQLDCEIGYSDHTIGVDAAVIGVAMGARIVEKHFTIDNNYSDFRDHQLSANPEDMALLVQKIRETEAYIGNYSKPINETELTVKSAARRSIAAKKDLEIGHVITSEDITWLRPGTGIPVGDEDKVIGKKLKISLNSGELIDTDSFV